MESSFYCWCLNKSEEITIREMDFYTCLLIQIGKYSGVFLVDNQDSCR